MVNSYIEKDDCCGCGACDNICPSGCINMLPDEEGFYFPIINKEKCIQCGKCVKACPVLQVKKKRYRELKRPAAYACIASNEETRLQSSSGGGFSILADYILSRHGVVFGAALSDDCKGIGHIEVENRETLWKLRGSKYVQSLIGRCYQEVKQYLADGRMVFFTGTPCQIEGLYRYLGRDYENLVTADLICHGVPSPNVWKKYIEYMEALEGAKVKQAFFRNKAYGWNKFALLLQYDNNKVYKNELTKDLYLQAFVRNSCLRKCCHKCNFKTVERISDFTMADLWGVENIFPDMDDDKGVSLLLVHSNKGKEIFEKIKSKCTIRDVSLDEAISFNAPAVMSLKAHPKRDGFLKHINDMPFDKAFRKYAYVPFSLRREAGKILHSLGLRCY